MDINIWNGEKVITLDRRERIILHLAGDIPLPETPWDRSRFPNFGFLEALGIILYLPLENSPAERALRRDARTARRTAKNGRPRRGNGTPDMSTQGHLRLRRGI